MTIEEFGRALVKLGFTHDPCGNRLGFPIEMGIYLACADDGYLTIIGPQNTVFNGCNAWTVPTSVLPEYHAKFETIRDAIAIPRMIRTIDDVRQLMAAIGLKVGA